MPPNPKVTVFIPVHNRYMYVGHAIESILRQSWRDFELLIVNDASTDSSLDCIRTFDDPRIRVISNAKNLGRSGTRNVGLEQAKGRYIAFLDDDDMAHPRRLEKQVSYLDSRPDVALVGSYYHHIDDKGKWIKGLSIPTECEDVLARLFFVCPMLQPTLMVRRDIAVQYPYRENFNVSEDHDWYIRLSSEHKMGNISEFLTYYRKHSGQSMKLEKKQMESHRYINYSAMLERAGIKATPDELDKHALLQKSYRHFARHDHISLDADYLLWASDWLQRIRNGFKCFDPLMQKAMSRACASVWCRLFTTAAFHNSPFIWRYISAYPDWKTSLFDSRARAFRARLAHTNSFGARWRQ